MQQSGALSLGPKSVRIHTGRFLDNNGQKTWQDGVTIHFDVGKRDEEDTEKGELKIFNLSSEIIRNIRPNYYIMVKSGYMEHYDTIFVGTIKGVNTSRKDGDMITTITCRGTGDEIRKATVESTTYDEQVSRKTTTWREYLDVLTSSIANEISYVFVGMDPDVVMWSDMYNATGELELPSSVNNTVGGMLDYIMEACGEGKYKTQWTVVNNRIYLWRGGEFPLTVRLTPLSGLISHAYSPDMSRTGIYETADAEEVGAEYKVKCILLYDIMPGFRVAIQPILSEDAYVYKIKEVNFKSDDDVHECEFLAERVGTIVEGFIHWQRESGYRRGPYRPGGLAI